MQQPFRPDHARFFRPFEVEYQDVPVIGELSHRINSPSDIGRLFQAWCRQRDDDATVRLLDGGSKGFYERYGRALADAQDGIQSILDKYLVDYKDRIDPVDEVGSCNDPILLFQMINGGLDGDGHRLDRAARIEAQRKLAIGSQLLAINAVDSFELVSKDLLDILLLARRRLFERTDRETIPLWFALDSSNANHVHSDVPITVRDRPEVVPEGLVLRRQDFSCRMVIDGARTYYVQTHSRPKTRISAVIKLERKVKLNDRRALRHVVVAVREGDVLRAATVDDIDPYAELSRRRLWHDELIEEPDMSPPNRFRSMGYIDRKILGRYFKPGRPEVLPSVEHQVTCVRAHLNGEHATDDVSHRNYKGKVIWECILPRWWPQDWYGIDWEAERKAP